jgi:Kef-type K+ transport system membrane component KefB
MADASVLLELGLVIVGSAVLLVAGRRVGAPPILVYMATGLVLGPATGLLTVSESVELFSELGVALLLFLVGLELSLEKIRDIGRAAVVVGVLQVGVTLGAGAVLARAFGFPWTEALFLGLATAFSSTVVVVKLLEAAGELTAGHGRISIGVLLVQDVLVAVVLTLVSGLAGGGGAAEGALGAGVARAFAGMAALVAVAVAGARWGLPQLFAWLTRAPEALFVVSLTWCFGFILAAEAMHVSVELGAFVAGVALAQLPQCSELRRRVHPLVDLFLAVFFVSLGAGMDLGGAAPFLLPTAALAAFVLVAKPAVVGLLVHVSGGGFRTSVLAGVTLGQISEFSLLLTGLAAASGLVRPAVLSMVGLLALVTIGASSVLMPRGEALLATLRGLPGRAPEAPEEAEAGGGPAPPTGHVVVVGMNTLGRRVARALAERGEDVVAVDTDPGKLADLPARIVVGDVSVPSVLAEAGAARAKLVVSALKIEDVNALLAYRCREMGVPTALHAFDPVVADELRVIGADHVLASSYDASRQMAASLRREGVLG